MEGCGWGLARRGRAARFVVARIDQLRFGWVELGIHPPPHVVQLEIRPVGRPSRVHPPSDVSREAIQSCDRRVSP